MNAILSQLNAPAVGNRAQVMFTLKDANGKNAGNMVLALHTDGAADEAEVLGLARDALKAAAKTIDPKTLAADRKAAEDRAKASAEAEKNAPKDQK